MYMYMHIHIHTYDPQGQAHTVQCVHPAFPSKRAQIYSSSTVIIIKDSLDGKETKECKQLSEV